MAKILIIDDDDMICRALRQAGERLGHTAFEARTLTQGVAAVARHAPDVVFLDVYMPDGNGLDYLPEIRGALSNPEVIIITGVGDAQGAELAIKSGAWDYLQKPFSTQELQLQMNRLAEYRERKSCAKRAILLDRKEVVGTSPAMMACLEQVAQCANSDANVMITGETGTGKELFARAIHDNSNRSGRRFVVVDCAALPDTLVESVLFGHVKGAFTGADATQEGLVKQADNGTLFLDEVGELSLQIQKKFLRVLQEQQFRPVGAKSEVRSNFRLVAATNRNLEAMAESGRFRTDLLYRLKSLNIHLPPLREHSEDIADIADHHVKRLRAHHETPAKPVSPEFIAALTDYPWPGNTRELVNTLEIALVNAQYDPMLLPIHLPIQIRITAARTRVTEKAEACAESASSGWSEGRPEAGPRMLPQLRDMVSRLEREYLVELMAYTQGDIKASCDISGLSRSRLYALLKKYNVSRYV